MCPADAMAFGPKDPKKLGNLRETLARGSSREKEIAPGGKLGAAKNLKTRV